MNVKIEKQRLCKAEELLDGIRKFEERIDTAKGWMEHGIYPVTLRDLKNLEFGIAAKARLEKSYKEILKS